MAEPIYNIKFAVGRAPLSATPSAPQPAGYFGDKGFARVGFRFKDATETANDHYYRIEIEDANGAYDITEKLYPGVVDYTVSYDVPAAWTAAGVATLRLVEFESIDGIETAVLHFPPVKLLFEARDSNASMPKMLPRWQATMSKAEEATVNAINATESALAAAEVALNAKGPKGDKGDIGPQGPKGEKGDPGEGGGESNVLIVKFSGNTTSHSSQEIYAAYQEGKAVFLYTNGELLNITSATAEQVDFDEIEPITLNVTQNSIVGTVYIQHTYTYEVPSDTSLTSPILPANAAVVGERLGDIKTALDGIITLQEVLIGGDSQ